MPAEPKGPRQGWGTPLRVAFLYTIVLRTACVLHAVLLRGHLRVDPRLILTNDLTDGLIGQLTPGGNPLVYAMLGVWERFDTLWYLHIAQYGYDRPATIVFYPLYPFLIRLLSWLVHPPLLAALLISTAAAFCFAWGLQSLIELDLPRPTAIRAIILLAVWPGSFIFFAAYADSLVMAFTVWSIYFARKGRWWLAGITGLLGGFSKAIGCLVSVALGYLAWRGKHRRLWAAAVLPVAAAAAFSLWTRHAGYPSSSSAYAAYWQTHVEFPWMTAARAIRAFFSYPPDVVLQLNLIFFVLMCLLVSVRKLRTEYKLYALATLAVFLTKSTHPLLQSTMRYLVTVFPAFIALAMLLEKHPIRLAILCTICGVVNGLLLFGFFRWSLLV